MMILVTGGASSGKSAYAEQVACALPAPHFYLAAMKPFLQIQGVRLDVLEAFLDREYAAGQVFPPRNQIFRAFAATPFEFPKIPDLHARGITPNHKVRFCFIDIRTFFL